MTTVTRTLTPAAIEPWLRSIEQSGNVITATQETAVGGGKTKVTATYEPVTSEPLNSRTSQVPEDGTLDLFGDY